MNKTLRLIFGISVLFLFFSCKKVNDDCNVSAYENAPSCSWIKSHGGSGEEACDYCQGNRDPRSSDNPDKATRALKNDREAEYKVYIAVQNELVAAYNVLRNREFARLYPNDALTYVEADLRYSDPRTSPDDKSSLKEKLDVIKALYPQKLSEAEPSKVN